MDIIELFAGVGGFRLGFEKVNEEQNEEIYNTVWANQWEPSTKNQFAYNCYANNFETGVNEYSNTNIFEVVELLKLNNNIIQDFDLLVGGFPCQDYSVATTKAKGIEGVKGVLWWAIKDIVEIKKPKYLLLENVDRLIKSPAKQRGRDFGIILKTLNDLGYDAEWRVINAADYGQPQRRRRVFIFASRRNLNIYNGENAYDYIYNEGLFAKAFPIESIEEKHFDNHHRHCDRVNGDSIIEISDDFEFTFENTGVCIDGNISTIKTIPIFEKTITLNEILLHNLEDESLYLSEEHVEKVKKVKGAKKIERISKDGHKYMYSEGSMQTYENLELPGRTMLTSEATINRSSHFVIDPGNGRPRKISPIEAERLNTFPDNWTDYNMTYRQRYFCMGNALVVNLITRMGKSLHEIDISK